MRPTLFAAVAVSILLVGCATPQNNYDPLEPVNRGIFAFNTVVDRIAVKPVAKVYRNYAPGPVKDGTHNFFANFDDFFSVFGNLLQGKVGDAGHSAGRVLVNTSVGMFGLVDWASGMGLKKTDEDLGQAIGHLGVGSGPYLMLPLLGPTSARDVVDPVSRALLDPVDLTYDVSTGVSIGRAAIGALDARAAVLPLDPLIESQIDPYAYLRDAWLQKRYNDVWDGNPPAPLQLGPGLDEGDEPDAATEQKTGTTATDASK
ncbi:phospholipid-binding lipoprotein MlaA [Andreprevotia lacus DSM 23236]|jgi:phospholipid-binding lipoprotein MlaA|uniref:Phospholipid-binding lipoprotein MlaA n=1 Tax=Andreprevotia lacus DSM 23236 TaxID=1121001 RepID=A0A1W1XSZ8_9NEIS|nr:VacJ family lipoprotein [Andreprevotia lacus]SMC27100.1 phospholipid-binding lipoprotein MlaA [Andreprevotia lacus DSM 23236]